ncbi:MAG: EVE domain-containing protein [Acidobacteria bacterium]|nr:EVE domain-containing protein [Acidobacteriota bacterium]
MRWLVKEEPENYSFAQFAKDGHTVWSGVRNPVAQRHLRTMSTGDEVFFYHTGKEKQVVGIARVTAPPRIDPNDRSASLYVVDLAPVRPLARPVTLAEAKAAEVFADSPLARVPRLSVMPITDAQWTWVLNQAGQG